MEIKKLSIIIPAFAEEENIPQLLTELGEVFTGVENFEVILVDDGSPVPLKNVVDFQNFDFEIILIENKYNLGQSKSIELGLKNSNGDVIGDIEFISDDRVVLSAPLVAIESVEAKGFFGRIWARIVFWILSLFSIGQND